MDDFMRSSSVSSYSSSGFESMLNSPTSEQDVWTTMQELRRKMEILERQTAGFPPSSSTPYASSRSRRESASSTGSTVIGGTHELHHGQFDLGSGGAKLFETRESGNKLLMENTLKLSSDNVDTMSKYENVVIKFAIVGERVRDPSDCTCNRHNCKRTGGGLDESKLEELMQKLEELERDKQLYNKQELAKVKFTQMEDMTLYEENQVLKRQSSNLKEGDDEEEETANSILEMSRETSKAEVEEVLTTKEEENKKYIISSVMDTETNEQISLDDAILQGIIDMQKGFYMDKRTGESMQIEEAMSNKLIDVTYKLTSRSPRQRSSYGIVTINKSVLPKGTLLIKAVKDTNRDETVSPEVAIKRGLLNKSMTRYIDMKYRSDYHIVDAVEQGFVQIENQQGNGTEPENISCVYKVSAVKDTRTGEMINFHDAVLRGLVMKEVGMCKDTHSGRFMYVGYAIISGMLKVDNVEDKK